ncbi:hypothetical protein BTUL_0071g00040 [Botrytis tulipae]|uniref:Uncharacterized protein n=1 Tax=Botrytis tulipae TaxID=87230 RepID=A0A4Z1EX01_9HELO|nr:hypothetical protein BTUL_0071g00040 [Botrytis tulipae]
MIPYSEVDYRSNSLRNYSPQELYVVVFCQLLLSVDCFLLGIRLSTEKRQLACSVVIPSSTCCKSNLFFSLITSQESMTSQDLAAVITAVIDICKTIELMRFIIEH